MRLASSRASHFGLPKMQNLVFLQKATLNQKTCVAYMQRILYSTMPFGLLPEDHVWGPWNPRRNTHRNLAETPAETPQKHRQKHRRNTAETNCRNQSCGKFQYKKQ